MTDATTTKIATIDDFPKKEKIIIITPKDTIPTAFEKIFENNILSAPVLDEQDKLLGSLTVIDILMFSINVCQTGQEIVSSFGLPAESKSFVVNFDSITNHLKTDPQLTKLFSSDSAYLVTNYAKQDSLVRLPPGTSFSTLLKELSTAHRVALTDSTKEKLINYITQSDLVKFIHQKKLLGDAGSKSIAELQKVSRPVVSINENELVIEGFKKIVTEKVSAVAVLDDHKKLVGCISAHDVRGISDSGELLEHLYHPYAKYKQILESLKVPTKNHVIKASADSTVEKIVDLLVSEKIHRVFVTNDDGTVCGVIALGDIIKYVSDLQK